MITILCTHHLAEELDARARFFETSPDASEWDYASYRMTEVAILAVRDCNDCRVL